VRSYKDEVRKHLLSAIERIADAEAAAAGADKKPTVRVIESVNAVYNDPKLTQRVAAVLRRALGDANVSEQQPIMGSDDFAEYGHLGVPALIFGIGAVEPAKLFGDVEFPRADKRVGALSGQFHGCRRDYDHHKSGCPQQSVH